MRKAVVVPHIVLFGGLLVLLATVFVFANMQGGFVPWFLFYALLVTAVYELSVVCVSLIGVDVQREFSTTRLQAGDTLEIKLHVKRNVRFPVPWLIVEDGLPTQLAQHVDYERNVFFPWFQERITISYTCPNMPRGRYRWIDVSFQSGDLFGWAHVNKTVRVTDEVLVHPRVYDLSGTEVGDKMDVGSRFSGTYMFNSRFTGMRGVRDYVHGDRLNHIHWKATARGLGLKTKLFDSETASGIVYVLDCYADLFDTKGGPSFERAVSAAASLVTQSYKQGHSIRFVSSGQSAVSMQSSEGDTFITRLLDHLAEIQADGTIPLERLLIEESDRFPRGTTLACITPQLNHSLVTVFERYVIKRCPVIVYVLGDAVEFGNRPGIDVRPVERLLANGGGGNTSLVT